MADIRVPVGGAVRDSHDPEAVTAILAKQTQHVWTGGNFGRANPPPAGSGGSWPNEPKARRSVYDAFEPSILVKVGGLVAWSSARAGSTPNQGAIWRKRSTTSPPI